jgi:hypothetical protein
MKYRQQWGTLSAYLSGSHALSDFQRNRVTVRNYASLRVFQGFSIRFNANIDFIRDQINIPKGDTTLEDLLLQQKVVASNFDMSLGVGFNYTFGSIYNNVLNTRL